jgi:hypothetical protein
MQAQAGSTATGLRRPSVAARWAASLALAACTGAAPPAGTAPRHEARTREIPAAVPPAPVARAQDGEPCGALACRRFADAASALRFVLREQPLALGVGEAHAPAGSEGIPTTAARFSEQLLPVLEHRASHLIVELLSPNRDCPAAARPLQQAQQPVIQAQSPENQSDYVRLGIRARALGIEPFVLTPSCEEFQAIADAGDDAIPRTLSTIAAITTRLLERALLQNRKLGRERLVVAYGGALHNDLGLDEARASFRYGNALSDFTGGRYVALDLIVRELIKDNAAWQALPWYGQFDPKSDPNSYVLLQPSPHSYVLFFPVGVPPSGGIPAAALSAAPSAGGLQESEQKQTPSRLGARTC